MPGDMTLRYFKNPFQPYSKTSKFRIIFVGQTLCRIISWELNQQCWARWATHQINHPNCTLVSRGCYNFTRFPAKCMKVLRSVTAPKNIGTHTTTHPKGSMGMVYIYLHWSHKNSTKFLWAKYTVRPILPWESVMGTHAHSWPAADRARGWKADVLHKPFQPDGFSNDDLA